MTLPQQIQLFIDRGDTDAAIAMLDEAIDTSGGSAAGMIYLRGRLHWKRGERARAMSDYARAAAIDPDSPAVQALEQARDIMDFFNHDLLNP